MSWLGALADIAIISSQVSVSQQMAQLQQQGVLMQLQGAQLAAIEAAQLQLRNEIFHFKNAAKELLLVEEEELPKRVAGHEGAGGVAGQK